MYLAMIVLLLGALVQAAVLPQVQIGQASVNLVLLLVVSWSMLRGIEEGTLWAIVGGICADLFSAAPFGVSIVALGCVALLAATIGEPLRQLHDYLPLISVALLTIVYYLVLGIAMALFGWPVDWTPTVALLVLPAATLNTLWMVPVHLLLRAVDRCTARPGWLP
ncbi:MAG: rod shape-determining protein MreD [Chloroflexi bacterium]|nr:rod shape-determining protein MreD [Chloroflexota bacterium]